MITGIVVFGSILLYGLDTHFSVRDIRSAKDKAAQALNATEVERQELREQKRKFETEIENARREALVQINRLQQDIDALKDRPKQRTIHP